MIEGNLDPNNFKEIDFLHNMKRIPFYALHENDTELEVLAHQNGYFSLSNATCT